MATPFYNHHCMEAPTLDHPARFSTTRAIAGDIKIAHSVFALPFALLAAFLAAAGAGSIDWGVFVLELLLIAIAMVCARTVAMVANRLLDRHIDALNPRTSNRAIPSGRLGTEQALVSIGLGTGVFLLSCLGFLWVSGNPWPIMLAAPVLLWISLYPLSKRFTFLCHAWLGSSLAMSPLAAALAVNPDALAEQPALWMLAGMVLAWVTGFDILYALQDVEIDRSQGLHSMPARLGTGTALWISRILHTVAVVLLVLAWVFAPTLGYAFLAGIIAACGLLIWEHVLIARFGTARISMAFFTLNGIVSCVLGLAGIIDVLVLSP
ncbi:MAG: 4-hydroxybenzoate octaprenyltransferase [Phycisphaerales bacterium]|nr:4-hydroxybenzoate octaprenyltransferase [Phycisphaerales bacterium]